MIHTLPVLLLALSAQSPPARAEEPPPGWFILRLKSEEALEMFKDFARKRESFPGGCSYGGKARIGELERMPEGMVAEIEYRLRCYETTPITAAPDIPRSQEVEREKVGRGNTNLRLHTVREKFLFVWTGEAWQLKGRVEGSGKPSPPKPPELAPGGRM